MFISFEGETERRRRKRRRRRRRTVEGKQRHTWKGNVLTRSMMNQPLRYLLVTSDRSQCTNPSASKAVLNCLAMSRPKRQSQIRSHQYL